MAFQVGDLVRVIQPDSKNPYKGYWMKAHAADIGKELVIHSTYQHLIGDMWVTLENSNMPILGFHNSWLEPANISQHLICQCSLQKLMNLGCHCGAFITEQL